MSFEPVKDRVWREGKYTGEWKDNLPNGKGRYHTRFGDVYEGEWIDGKLHGKGKCVRFNGECYDGYFKEGLYHSFGVIIRCNGDRYSGEWKMGFEEGEGEMVSCTGIVYKGTFKKGKMIIGTTYENNKYDKENIDWDWNSEDDSNTNDEIVWEYSDGDKDISD
jgi:hypothetical protein